MAHQDALDTTSHLVAHVLREIENALRQVLRPTSGQSLARSASSASQNQEAEIKALLKALTIAEDTVAGKAWIELGDRLHGLAHRRRFEAPRDVEEVRELWEKAQALLDVVLDHVRSRFLLWFRILDELLAEAQPTKNHVKRLANEVPNNAVTRGYFFHRLESPQWIEPLRKAGFFGDPPGIERDDAQETIRFLPWPEAHYLARMARHKPELVASIVLGMPDTDNASVQSALLDAALAMPPHIASQLVGSVSKWAVSPYLLVPDKCGKLVAHLARGGRVDEAMGLASVLFEILPDPAAADGAENRYRLPSEPRARFDLRQYEWILNDHHSDLAKAAGLPALDLLCNFLEKAIRLSRRFGENDKADDSSCIWRPAIEDHPQNFSHTLNDALVDAVRETSDLLVRAGKATVEEVVETLEKRPQKVFHRIALHLLRMHAEQAIPLITAHLTDRGLFDDSHLLHEYVLLMRECFGRLAPEGQQTILGWIEAGPNIEDFKRREEEHSGLQPPDENVTQYREIWQRDRLAWIGEGLPDHWKSRYRELVNRYNEPEHPDFSVYMEFGSVGQKSPRMAEELGEMAVDQVVEFLKTWTHPLDPFGEPSPEGLGRVLSSVVSETPEQFASEATRFRGLDPTYVRALLADLRDGLQQNRPFEWDPVLELCEWVVAQPREIEGRRVQLREADPDWGWTRKAIASLLSAGFDDRPGSLSFQLRESVWSLLEPLTDDPEPTPEHEREYGGTNMDPATLCINTTRGEAMHAVVRYALWVRRHFEQEVKLGELLQRGFAEMPEVRRVLEVHLDVSRDPSFALQMRRVLFS